MRVGNAGDLVKQLFDAESGVFKLHEGYIVMSLEMHFLLVNFFMPAKQDFKSTNKIVLVPVSNNRP